MNKILTIIAAAFLVFTLAACNSGSSSAPSSETTPQIKTPDGTWTYESEGVKFVGTISNETMEIQFHPDETTSGLYWKGTFDAQELKDEDVIVSEGDMAELDKSLYGSLNSEKTFIYKDGNLEFDFIMMGVTKKVTLTKQ